MALRSPVGDPVQSGFSPSPMGSGGDPEALIKALRERGADRFDPVRFRFVEALARRAERYGGDARCLLDGRLAKAVKEYGERLEKARDEARDLVSRLSERFPEAAEELERVWDSGDFGELRRLAASLGEPRGRGPLADLADCLALQGPGRADTAPAIGDWTGDAPRGELKSVSYFRDTWSRLSVDQQLAQALAQAPENAGPLNSHLLVLQSLKQMRDISPGYLNRFISYVGALLWLEQANGAGVAAKKNAVRGEAEKKRKSGCSKSG